MREDQKETVEESSYTTKIPLRPTYWFLLNKTFENAQSDAIYLLTFNVLN